MSVSLVNLMRDWSNHDLRAYVLHLCPHVICHKINFRCAGMIIASFSSLLQLYPLPYGRHKRFRSWISHFSSRGIRDNLTRCYIDQRIHNNSWRLKNDMRRKQVCYFAQNNRITLLDLQYASFGGMSQNDRYRPVVQWMWRWLYAQNSKHNQSV